VTDLLVVRHSKEEYLDLIFMFPFFREHPEKRCSKTGLHSLVEFITAKTKCLPSAWLELIDKSTIKWLLIQTSLKSSNGTRILGNDHYYYYIIIIIIYYYYYYYYYIIMLYGCSVATQVTWNIALVLFKSFRFGPLIYSDLLKSYQFYSTRFIDYFTEPTLWK